MPFNIAKKKFFMRETVSNNSSIKCSSVPVEEIWQVLRWIHCDLSESDFASLIADVKPVLAADPALSPLELVDDGARIAAAYFVPLGGSVATLGGLRAIGGHETQAGQILQEFQCQLNNAGIAQIQALVDVNDLSSKIVMLHSPFRQATTVRHLWFDLVNIGCTAEISLAGYTCQPANQVARSEIDALVEATFFGTLDCPDLEGLRSAADVVSGFLESQDWNERLPWWVLRDGVKPIGCALVNKHAREIYELVYVGLIPSCRGRGLGRALIDFVIHDCRKLGGSFIATAVDTQNWPAGKIYDSLGFSEIRELAVWLPKVPNSRKIAA
jgi:ribosomal protein S18 acetylase RimI-like enzyme